MRKKLKLLVALAFMVCIPIGGFAQSTIGVSDAQNFINQARGSNHIKLNGDIDLSECIPANGEVALINETFTGTIDGRGKDAQGNDVVYSIKGANYVIFKEISSANVHDVVISGSFSAADECSGMLTYSATNSTFEDISLAGIQGVYTTSITYECDCVGGLVGKAEGCTFTSILCDDVDLEANGNSVGIVAGYAKNCTFNKCISNIRCSIWADGSASGAFVGGIVGYAEGGTISNCMNLALLTAKDDEIGGIAGHAKGTRVELSSNSGILLHASKESYQAIRTKLDNAIAAMLEANNDMSTEEKFLYGGAGIGLGVGAGVAASLALASFSAVVGGAGLAIFGSALTGIGIPVAIVAAITFGIYNSQDPDEIGGICGRAEKSSTISGCTNSGMIRSLDAYAGGIVGYLDESTVEDCCNRGAVYAAEQAGGIVGMNDDSHINRCLSLGSVVITESGAGRFSGATSGTTTLTYCCYASFDGDTGSIDGQKPVSAKQLASGSVAAYFNHLDGDKSCWNQKLAADGTNDFVPYPGAKATAVTNSQVLENPNYTYKVSNANELSAALMIVNADISLTADIDMNNTALVTGSNVTSFRGKINGNGHVISKVKNIASNKRWGIVQVAEHATFSDFTIENSSINTDGNEYEWIGLLVGESYYCSFQNLTVKNSSVETVKNLAGCLSGESNADTFMNCHTLSTTVKSHISSSNSWVGSLAGKAMNSTFENCSNSGEVRSYGTANGTGGLVGEATGCKISKCINTGIVSGNEYLGGIAGVADNTGFFYCVNTGTIDGSTSCDKIANIVGRIVNPANDAERKIYQCIALGKIFKGTNGDGRIYGSSGGGSVEYCTALTEINAQDCVLNDLLSGNYTVADVASGKMTYDLNVANFERLDITDTKWFQSIDNGVSSLQFPVPFASYGKVYRNVLTGTTAYSNTSDHTCKNYGGFCKLCREHMTHEKGGTVNIANYQDLVNFRYAVNHGNNTLNANVTCSIDIPHTDVEPNWEEPIGIWDVAPYRGTFCAPTGAVISHLYVKTPVGTPAGLFGTVSDGCNISGIIVNGYTSTGESNTSETYGVAGIVGCAQPTDGKCNVTITRCGNEGEVSNGVNSAGIIGGIYGCDNLDDATLTLTDCYNAASIWGVKESAGIVGWTRHLNATRCVNYGTVINDNEEGGVMLRYNPSANINIQDCYYSNKASGNNDGKTTLIDNDDLRLGIFCQQLNNKIAAGYDLWGQGLSNDAYPTLFKGGVYLNSQMLSSKWNTAVMPYTIYANESVQLYLPKALNGNKLVLQPVEEVEANTPCFLKKLDESDYVNVYTWGDYVAPSGPLTYTTENGITMLGSYTTVYHNDGGTWYDFSMDCLKSYNALSILPFKAIISFGSNNSAKSIQLFAEDDDEVTQIGEIIDGKVTFFDGPTYNVAGQRVTSGSATSYKGILIKNGKKVLVK